jgi:hypothetical protein
MELADVCGWRGTVKGKAECQQTANQIHKTARPYHIAEEMAALENSGRTDHCAPADPTRKKDSCAPLVTLPEKKPGTHHGKGY